MKPAILVLLFCAAALWADDFNGRWWGDAVTSEGSFPVWITLIQQGDHVTGTGGPTKTEQNVIENVKVAGNKVTFDVGPGNRAPLHFELSLQGGELKGTATVLRNGQNVTGKVSLKKRTT